MRRYYYDDSFYVENTKEKWNVIFEFLINYGDCIEIVEEVISSSDIGSRQKIKELLSSDESHFRCAKPIDKTVTLCPFFEKKDYISVCFKYPLNKEVLEEMKSEWTILIDNSELLPAFIVYGNDDHILWHEIVHFFFLLERGEKYLFQNTGFELTEYDVSLNQVLYKISRGR